MNLDEKASKRFSINSIKTQCSKFNNDTLNNMSGMSTPGRHNMNVTNQERPGLTTPQVACADNNDTTLNNDDHHTDDTIDFDNPNKLTELPSIYFKPCAAVEATPGTIQENRNDNQASYRVSFTESK